MLALVGGAAKAIGGGIVKNVAKDKAKSFITGKKKKVKPEAIKKGGDSSTSEKGGSALVVRPQTSLVPQITPVSVSEVSSESKSSDDTLTLIKTKVFEINKFLKGSLAQEKASSKKDKKSAEKQKRKKQEGVLEKIAPKPKGILKKITAPAKGLFDGIFNFISNVLLGRLLIILLEKKPNLPGGNLLMFFANTAEKIIDIIIGTLDAFGSFLAFGQEKLDGAKDWLKEHKGNDAVERFDGLLGALTNLFNAAVIVGSVFAALGIAKPPKGPKKPEGPKGQKPGVKPQTKPFGKGKPGMKPTGPSKAARLVQKNHGHAARGIYQNAIDNGKSPKAAQAAVNKALKKGQIVSKPQTGSLGGTDKGSKIAKGGLKKVPKRLATKVLGKAGIKTIKGIAKGFSKIPIVGPIIVAVSSLLAGEPPAQALFKGLGAALGGFLGTFIPIPVVGTLIGEALGVFVGDLLYTLILGKGPKAAGEKLVKAFKTIMDIGGLALKFFMDGGKRFIDNFPTVDVPDIRPGQIFANILSINPLVKAMMDFEVKIPGGGGRHFMIDRLPLPDEWKTALKEGFSIRGMFDGLPGLQEVLGMFAQFIPGMDKYIENGALKKVPNLLLTTPPGLPFLMPHVAKSFLPGLFGEKGDVKPNNQANTPPSDSSIVSSEVGKEEGGGGLFGGLFGGGGGDASAAMPNVSTQGADLRNQTEGSKIAGELGKYLNREGLKWGSGVTEHPEHGGVQPVHTGGSYHYKEQGYRAIDIGGWGPNRFKREGQSGTDDQTKIIAGIQKFNKEKGVKPIEFITEATDPTYHNDHVHIAYGLGGLVRGITHAMLGESGKEFVIDNDSYTAIESAYPGLLSAINKAKGKDAVEALMAYTDYERPPEPEMAMAGGSSGGGSDSYGDSGESGMVSSNVSEGSSGTNSGWKDIRYKFG